MENRINSTLPDSWTLAATRDGRIFFVNDRLRQTTWLHPVTKTPIATGHQRMTDLPCGWERGINWDGSPYYVNHNKQETTLNHPNIKEVTTQPKPEESEPPSTPQKINMESNRRSPKKKKATNTNQVRSPIVKRPNQAPVMMQGWLWKQGSDAFMRWKKRWFVLADFCLFYYNGPEEDKVLGSILLPSYEVSSCANESKVNRKFAFKLELAPDANMLEHQNMRTYYLATETEQLYQQWINVIALATLLQRESSREERLESILVRPEVQYHPASQYSGNDDEDSGFTSYHSRRYVGPSTQDENSPLNESYMSEPMRVRAQDGYRTPESGYLGNAEKYPNYSPQGGGMYPPPKPKRMQHLNPELYHHSPPSKMVDYRGYQMERFPQEPASVLQPANRNVAQMSKEDWGAQVNYGYSDGIQAEMEDYRNLSPKIAPDYRDQYDPAVLREKGHKIYHMQRPHSANFLEQEPEVMRVIMRNTSKSGNRNRPKSSGELYPDNEYTWDPDDTHQQAPLHTPHTAYPDMWKAQHQQQQQQHQHHHQHQQPPPPPPTEMAYHSSPDSYPRPNGPVREPRPASHIREPVGEAQFLRSASARLASTGPQQMTNSGSIQQHPEETRANQQREESMKRLLEWKQRMLQSPLTKKAGQPKTPPMTPKKIVDNVISKGSRIVEKPTAFQRYRNSYSSDDEDCLVKGNRRRMRRSTQAGKNRKQEAEMRSNYVNINDISLDKKTFKDSSVQTAFPIEYSDSGYDTLKMEAKQNTEAREERKFSDDSKRDYNLPRMFNEKYNFNPDYIGYNPTTELEFYSSSTYDCGKMFIGEIKCKQNEGSLVLANPTDSVESGKSGRVVVKEKMVQQKWKYYPDSQCGPEVMRLYDTKEELYKTKANLSDIAQWESVAKTRNDDNDYIELSETTSGGSISDLGKKEVEVVAVKLHSGYVEATPIIKCQSIDVDVEDERVKPTVEKFDGFKLTFNDDVDKGKVSGKTEVVGSFRKQKESPPKNIVQDRIKIFEAASGVDGKGVIKKDGAVSDVIVTNGAMKGVAGPRGLPVEEYYIPMRSGLKSWLFDESVYVQMDEKDAAQDKMVYLSAHHRGCPTDVDQKMDGEVEESYNLLTYKTDSYEPIYAELEHPNVNKSDDLSTKDQVYENFRMSSSLKLPGRHSDASDADDEFEVNQCRFSMSDNFRPASYFLMNEFRQNGGSSDEELDSPPPIPQSPPPLEELDVRPGNDSVEKSPPKTPPYYQIATKDDSSSAMSSPYCKSTTSTNETCSILSSPFSKMDGELNYSYYRVYEDEPRYTEIKPSSQITRFDGQSKWHPGVEWNSAPYYYSDVNLNSSEANSDCPPYLLNNSRDVNLNVNKKQNVGRKVNLIQPITDLDSLHWIESKKSEAGKKNLVDSDGEKEKCIFGKKSNQSDENDVVRKSEEIFVDGNTTKHFRQTFVECTSERCNEEKKSNGIHALRARGSNFVDRNSRRTRSLEDLTEADFGVVSEGAVEECDWRRMSRSLDHFFEIDRESLRQWDMMSSAPLSRLKTNGVGVRN